MKLEIPDDYAVTSITFGQPSDSCSHREQKFTLSLDDAGAGAFLIISASRWSLDDDCVSKDLAKISAIGKQMCASYDEVFHPPVKTPQ